MTTPTLNCCTVNTRGFNPPMYIIGCRIVCRLSSSQFVIDDFGSVSSILVVVMDTTPKRYHTNTARGTDICPDRAFPCAFDGDPTIDPSFSDRSVADDVDTRRFLALE
mmetsp:Transcript_3654/g.10412  ORF Transcript_3654/g.10412 Transcript_3654/m.10412 type:complete len:108 (-) Transcript_3654:475-798(-)